MILPRARAYHGEDPRAVDVRGCSSRPFAVAHRGTDGECMHPDHEHVECESGDDAPTTCPIRTRPALVVLVLP